MTHPEIENLASDYIEGQLDAALGLQVEAHLAGCAPCAELVAGVRSAIELCRDAADVPPPSWLVSKILLATLGERKPTVRERLAGWFRPVSNPRFAYAVAMAVFSFSIILNAAGLNLRNLNLTDLNPRTWVYNATRAGHLMYARAEKFYYDLRFVYEVQSRFRELESQPQPARSKPGSKPGGATTVQPPFDPRLAMTEAPVASPSSGSPPARSTKP